MKKDVADNPPVFNSWKKWYIIVLTVLVVQIVFYYWLTSLFS